MKKKIFAVALAACLVVLSVVSGTVAYFTDHETASHTFTSGNVAINLTFSNNDNTVNTIYPGQVLKYAATVKSTGTETSYTGIIVTIDRELSEADVNALFGAFDANYTVNYIAGTDKTTVRIAYNNILAKDGSVTFFDDITIPTTWGNDEMSAFSGVTFTVDAYAIQSAGFTSAVVALAAATEFNGAWAN